MSDKILVVEDDFANQQVATLFLRRFGYECEVVENGQLAIDAAQQQKYSLIYMDCQMPLVDGFTASITIRSQQGLNQLTPIVALTANMVSGIKQQCLDAGMDDVICKPISMDTMQQMTEHWFAKKSTSAMLE